MNADMLIDVVRRRAATTPLSRVVEGTGPTTPQQPGPGIVSPTRTVRAEYDDAGTEAKVLNPAPVDGGEISVPSTRPPAATESPQG